MRCNLTRIVIGLPTLEALVQAMKQANYNTVTYRDGADNPLYNGEMPYLITPGSYSVDAAAALLGVTG